MDGEIVAQYGEDFKTNRIILNKKSSFSVNVVNQGRAIFGFDRENDYIQLPNDEYYSEIVFEYLITENNFSVYAVYVNNQPTGFTFLIYDGTIDNTIIIKDRDQ